MASQNLVKAGTRWRIVSGNRVRVLEDGWLLDSTHPFVDSRHPALVDQYVNSLMKAGVKEWDLEVIRDLYEDRDQLICGIPLSYKQEEDIQFWSRERSGFYTVKSAYSLL